MEPRFDDDGKSALSLAAQRLRTVWWRNTSCAADRRSVRIDYRWGNPDADRIGRDAAIFGRRCRREGRTTLRRGCSICLAGRIRTPHWAKKIIRSPRSGDDDAANFQLVVIGAGVAGLTAAMFAALATVSRSRSWTSWNRAGRSSTLSGSTASPVSRKGSPATRAARCCTSTPSVAGAEFVLDTVEGLEVGGEHRIVRGAVICLRARAVVIAAGSSLRSLGVAGEETFLGRGVSHCASCDGAFFVRQEACVIGGGDSALDGALVLAQHAARVTVLHRGESLDAQQALRDQAAAIRKIEVVLADERRGDRGRGRGSALRLRDLRTARRPAGSRSKAYSSMSVSSRTPLFVRGRADARSRSVQTLLATLPANGSVGPRSEIRSGQPNPGQCHHHSTGAVSFISAAGRI